MKNKNRFQFQCGIGVWNFFIWVYITKNGSKSVNDDDGVSKFNILDFNSFWIVLLSHFNCKVHHWHYSYLETHFGHFRNLLHLFHHILVSLFQYAFVFIVVNCFYFIQVYSWAYWRILPNWHGSFHLGDFK